MMNLDFWIKAAQLIVSLTILVFVHELGHFMWARIFKVRVDKFYLFFNPNFSIFRAKKINGKWQVRWFAKNPPDLREPMRDSDGNSMTDRKGKPMMRPIPIEQLPEDDWRHYPETTEWGIGWIPLGGYCSINGMVDETSTSGELATKPQPWEYRSQSAWKRLLIITGGVLNNFIAALIIYAMMLFAYGEEYLPLSNAHWGYDYCKTAQNNGFVNGDIITAINGMPVQFEKDAIEKIIIEGKTDITVRRNNLTTQIKLPQNFGEQFLEAKETGLMTLRFPMVVDSVMPTSAAAAAGFQKGDSLLQLDGIPMMAADMRSYFANHADQTVAVNYIRQGALRCDTLTVNHTGQIGIQLRNPYPWFTIETKHYGFFASIPAGISRGFSVLGSYVKQFRLVFTKAGAQSLGGFGTIGNLFPATWDWSIFWNMTAFLSIILAFMNILPIPILDGGYVLFILYEIITRRKPSERFMEISLQIGMFLLLALLIFANGNDLYKWLIGLMGK